MENLKETMDKIQFSENAEDNMLRAMRLAKNEKKAEGRVARSIRLHKIRQWAVSFAAVAILVVVFSNSSVQAAVEQTVEAILSRMFSNYKESFIEGATPLEQTIQQDGYTLHIYSMAQGNSTTAFEVELSDPSGKDALKDGSLFVIVNNDCVEECAHASHPYTFNNGNHYWLVSELGGSLSRGNDYTADFCYYMDGWESTLNFPTVRYRVDNIIEDKEYAINKTVKYEGIDIEIEKVIDSGACLKLYYSCDMEAFEKAGKLGFLVGITSKGRDLYFLGGSGDESQNVLVFEKAGFDSSDFELYPRYYTEDGEVIEKDTIWK